MTDFGIKESLKVLGIKASNSGVSTGTKWIKSKGGVLQSFSPVDGRLIGKVAAGDKNSFDKVIKQSRKAFAEWSRVPAPKRGEVVRQIGESFRKNK